MGSRGLFMVKIYHENEFEEPREGDLSGEWGGGDGSGFSCESRK